MSTLVHSLRMCVFVRVLGERNIINRYGVATSSRPLQIIGSFAEYCLFYRVLLQKRHILV